MFLNPRNLLTSQHLVKIIAQLADEDKVLQLQKEQNEIISFLKDKEGTIKQKILRMAQILEERMERADPELPPSLTTNMISSEIRRILRNAEIAAADNVNHYLPDKYKDPSQQRIVLVDGSTNTANDIEIIKLLGKDIRLLNEKIRKLSDHEDIETVYEIADEMKKATAARATELGLILPGFEKKEQIKTPTPPPEITDCAEATNYLIDKLHNFHNFLIKFPPPAEKNPLWASGIVQLADLFPSYYNEKFSLIKIMWWSRIKYMTHQSKHGAAVKDEIMTMLCENCFDLKTGRDKPGTNAEMIRDFKSPTGFRCGSCYGIQGHMRGLTREQVGDNKEPVITQCERFLAAFPWFVDMCESYDAAYMPFGYARKTSLGVELSSKA